eukprot:385443-Pelagomonas_calceolata.AAC.2
MQDGDGAERHAEGCICTVAQLSTLEFISRYRQRWSQPKASIITAALNDGSPFFYQSKPRQELALCNSNPVFCLFLHQASQRRLCSEVQQLYHYKNARPASSQRLQHSPFSLTAVLRCNTRSPALQAQHSILLSWYAFGPNRRDQYGILALCNILIFW